MTKTLVLASILVGVAGCNKEMTTSADAMVAPVPLSAHALFDRDVFPILQEKCVACHARASNSNVPGFIDTDAATAYANTTAQSVLVGDFTPNGTPLLLEVRDGHEGIVYTDAELALIYGWLAEELAERP